MSRSISIWYQKDDQEVDIEVGPHDLLGAQSKSRAFWKLPIIQQIGVQRLAELGRTDPVWFTGWDEIRTLEHEITLLEEHETEIEFPPAEQSAKTKVDSQVSRQGTSAYPEQLKLRWIRNLRYCLNQLQKTAPSDAIPHFMIG